MTGPPFASRRDAGRQLARAVAALNIDDPLVLALPRGGVPVAVEVARVLQAPLDLLLVRKIGAPRHAEFGIAAVVDGDAPHIVLNEENISMVAPPAGYIEAESRRALAELGRRRKIYLGQRARIPAKGRTVIIIDDGIATGVTMTAALKGIKAAGATSVVLAIPVAPPDVIEMLTPEVDTIVCLWTPEPFRAVGAYYADFAQVSDQEMMALLQDHS